MKGSIKPTESKYETPKKEKRMFTPKAPKKERNVSIYTVRDETSRLIRRKIKFIDLNIDDVLLINFL